MIEPRISRFLKDPRCEDFNRLALDAFAFQYQRILPLRELSSRRGITPRTVRRWQDVPLVPTSAFKSLRLRAAPAKETFRSSGTSQKSRSLHEHPFPQLYRVAIDVSFPYFCLRRLSRLPMLSLIPSRRQLPDSSLSFMVDHILHGYATPDSLTAFASQGVEVARAVAWLEAHGDQEDPALILTTSLALLQCLDGLESRRLRFQLPEGSVLFETGGFKGSTVEASPQDLLGRVERLLGLSPQQVVREYGMTELTSQAYTRAVFGGDPDLFVTPHWMQVRILDPESLEEAPAGSVGLIAIFDLANVGSALHLLTEDLGTWERGGFRLVGRAAGAELRGCSLIVDELSATTKGAPHG